jgi:hypothetical protein
MSDIRRSNDQQHVRRNPGDSQGQVTGGGGDLMGDEQEQVDKWDELLAEEQGQSRERAIDDVGSAQDAIYGTTGMLDDVKRPLYDRDSAPDPGKDQIKDRDKDA